MSTLINSLKIIKFSIPHFKDYLLLRAWAIFLSIITGKPIRISFAYLHQIKRGDEYLLIKTSKGLFQPPGGVYKARNGSPVLNSEIAENDYITGAPEDDFRAILKKPTYLFRVYDEFISQKNRETEFGREFEEELLKRKILPRRVFNWREIIASKINQHALVEIGKDVISFYHFDIISLDLNIDQNEFITEMSDYKINKYAWVKRENLVKPNLILKSDFNPKTVEDHDKANIAPHSKYLI
jgi:hypothetical protein